MTDGFELKVKRQSYGIRQRDIAKIMNRSQTHISLYESAEVLSNSVKLEYLDALQKALEARLVEYRAAAEKAQAEL